MLWHMRERQWDADERGERGIESLSLRGGAFCRRNNLPCKLGLAQLGPTEPRLLRRPVLVLLEPQLLAMTRAPLTRQFQGNGRGRTRSTRKRSVLYPNLFFQKFRVNRRSSASYPNADKYHVRTYLRIYIMGVSSGQLLLASSQQPVLEPHAGTTTLEQIRSRH